MGRPPMGLLAGQRSQRQTLSLDPQEQERREHRWGFHLQSKGPEYGNKSTIESQMLARRYPFQSQNHLYLLGQILMKWLTPRTNSFVEPDAWGRRVGFLLLAPLIAGSAEMDSNSAPEKSGLRQTDSAVSSLEGKYCRFTAPYFWKWNEVSKVPSFWE